MRGGGLVGVDRLGQIVNIAAAWCARMMGDVCVFFLCGSTC